MVSDNMLPDTISGTHSVLTEFSNEGFTMNAQDGCRSAQVSLMGIEHAQDMVTLQILQCDPPLSTVGDLGPRSFYGRGQVLRADDGIRAQCDGSLYRMFQLANITRPPILLE